MIWIGPKNDIYWRKVSATHRFYYESLTVMSSIPVKSILCRELSAIKDVHYEAVWLYIQNVYPTRNNHASWLYSFCKLSEEHHPVATFERRNEKCRLFYLFIYFFEVLNLHKSLSLTLCILYTVHSLTRASLKHLHFY